MARELEGSGRLGRVSYITKFPATASAPVSTESEVAESYAVRSLASTPLSEDFESGLDSRWTLSPTSSSAYSWGVTTCDKHGGAYAADATRGGTLGAALDCTAGYPSSRDTWLEHAECEAIQGPGEAWLDLHLATATEANYDSLAVMFLGQDGKYWGWIYSGNYSPWWHAIFNLRAWYQLGDLTLLPCTRLAFRFHSDWSVAGGFGARIDDVKIITGSTSGPSCAISATPTTGPAPLTVAFGARLSGFAGGPAYSWNFGDGSSGSSAAEPTHTFSQPGDYDVSLFATEQSDRCISTLRISVDTPGNDTCQGATEIPSNVHSETLNTAAYSTSNSEPRPCGSIGATAWYSFTPTEPGRADISLCSSDFDTVLGIYAGPCDDVVRLTCNDDACGNRSAVTSFTMNTGVPYLIQVGGYLGRTGNAQLDFAFTPDLGCGSYLSTSDDESNTLSGRPDGDWGECLFNSDLRHPIEFNIPVTGALPVARATLRLLTWDVDETGGEVDQVYFNGHLVGTLTGANQEDSTTALDINPSWVVRGNNLVQILVDIDNPPADRVWCVQVKQAQLIVDSGCATTTTCRSVTTDRGDYVFGDAVAVSTELDTSLATQEIRVETNIFDPNGLNVAGTARVITIRSTANDAVTTTLQLPESGAAGSYRVESLVSSAGDGTFLTSCSTLIGVRHPTIDVASLDHLEVHGPPSTVRSAERFDVSVRAEDATGRLVNVTGTVALTLPGCLLSPTTIEMVEGVAATTGAKVLQGCGDGLRLEASLHGATGSSAALSVPCGAVGAASIVGRVTDEAGIGLPEAVVSITRRGGGSPTTAIAGPDGYYQAVLGGPGLYDVQATYDGRTETRRNFQSVPGRPVTCNITVGHVCSPDGPTPVLLVPGLMGSTIIPAFQVPILPRGALEWDDVLWPPLALRDVGNPGGLLDTWPTVVGWKQLISALETARDKNGEPAGYRVGCSIFVVPYDWRLRPDQSAREYLQKKIDHAKNLSHKTKVDIVAHSMGGLVARAYIQGGSYEDRRDVSRLIMVGTPNRGSPLSYFLWEGGTASAADRVQRNLGGGAIPVYSIVTNRLCSSYYHPLGGCAGIDSLTHAMIQRWVPSLGALMPSSSFLVREAIAQSPTCPDEIRTWLSQLNLSPRLDRFTTWDGSAEYVRTLVLFARETPESATLAEIPVGAANCERILYKDGIPTTEAIDEPSAGPGDGTVPADSVFLPSAAAGGKELATYHGEKAAKHMGLIAEYKAEIVDHLTGRNSAAPSAAATTADTLLPFQRTLTLSTAGPATFTLIDPQGRANGTGPASGALLLETPGTEVASSPDDFSVTIPSSQDGAYLVTVRSTWPTAAPLVASITAGSEVHEVKAAAFVGTTPFTFEIRVTPRGDLTFMRSPLRPEGVLAEPRQGAVVGTVLTWAPVPGAAAYRAWGRTLQDAETTLLGETSDARIELSTPWAAGSVTAPQLLQVSAVDGAGNESFLSEVVLNNDRDHDGLPDSEEAGAGSQPDNADSDGDGLLDGEEARKGTNPLAADTDADGYPDEHELAAASDPLAATSVPRVTYLVPSVAHSPGAAGTQWRTDVSLLGSPKWAANVEATFIDSNGTRTGPVRLNMPSRSSASWPDVLVSQFGIGSGASSKGSLLFTSDAPLPIVSRTYNRKSATETFGQSYPALRPGDRVRFGQIAILPQIKKTQRFRTNIGFANPSSNPVEVTLSLHGPDGQQLGSTWSAVVAPLQWTQIDDAFVKLGAGARSLAYAKVRILTEDGGVWAYASVVDAVTGDPTTFPALFGGRSGPLFVPSVAHSPGAQGTRWRTDLAVVNPNQSTLPVDLVFSPYNAATSPTVRTVSLPPHGTIEWQDVLVSLFGYSDQGAIKGTVEIRSDMTAYVSSRTYNDAGSGTFGQSYPAVSRGEALTASDRAVIPQLVHTSLFRSNAGVVNVGSGDCSIELVLHRSSGEALGKALTVTLGPGRYWQWDDVFKLSGGTSASTGYATVKVLTENGRIWAYGSVVDNTSGDPTTVPVLPW